jgi:hypothetical protein
MIKSAGGPGELVEVASEGVVVLPVSAHGVSAGVEVLTRLRPC